MASFGIMCGVWITIFQKGHCSIGERSDSNQDDQALEHLSCEKSPSLGVSSLVKRWLRRNMIDVYKRLHGDKIERAFSIFPLILELGGI